MNIAAKIAPPEHCATLDALVARDGGAWEERSHSGRIDYPLPAYASTEVLDYLRPLASVRGEWTGLAMLPAGRVFGAGTVLSSDGSLLARDVSGDLASSESRHWLLDCTRMRAPRLVAGATAVAAVNLGSGYAHWLLEELPRLLSIPVGRVDNIVAHAASAWAREALALRGGRERVIAVRREQHLACAPLVVPTLAAAAGAPAPGALRRLDEFTGALGREASFFGEKLYFTRAGAGRRRVRDEAALWALLAPLGFEKLALEELSWSAQIAACRRARAVVAPHGAGLANLVFCAPGTRVVELFNRRYVNPGYWRLAALRGLDYRPILSAGDGSPREERAANREDIAFDPAQVRAALR
jgi:capsular polysaccharide biosynthesis protein